MQHSVRSLLAAASAALAFAVLAPSASQAAAPVFTPFTVDKECSEFVEVNELKWLFRGSPKWTWQDAHRLADAGWDYIGFE